MFAPAPRCDSSGELRRSRRLPALHFNLIERLERQVDGEGAIVRFEGVQVSEQSHVPFAWRLADHEAGIRVLLLEPVGAPWTQDR